MTTVAQLIEFLKQFPEDTKVEVLAGQTSRNYSGDTFGRVDMSLAETVRTDWYFSGTSFEYSVAYGQTDPTLFLGEED